jgi:hypothetical protein
MKYSNVHVRQKIKEHFDIQQWSKSTTIILQPAAILTPFE